MSTFQTISPSSGSQFITNSCKDCICVDFQVSSNKYQWRDQYIPDDEQVCWECGHKALSHRWGRGEIDFPTDTMFVDHVAESDPYEGPINSSPLRDLESRRTKNEKDATSPSIKSECDEDVEGKGSPFRGIGTFVPRIVTPEPSTISSGYKSAIAGVADSTIPRPAVAERRKTVNWADTIGESPQRSPAVKKNTTHKSAAGRIESTRPGESSPTSGNTPSPPPEDPNCIPTEPKVPTGKLTLTGIMEYLVLKNQYDTWERRNSHAMIRSVLSEIQGDLAYVKGKLGSIPADDDFASAATGTPKTPYDNARSQFWDYSEAQRMARSPGPSPMSSPFPSRNTEPPRAIPNPFITAPRPSSAPSFRHRGDNSRHATRQTIRMAPPSPNPGRITAVPPINSVGIAISQAVEKGKMVIREEINEDYDSYDSEETDIDDEHFEVLERHQKAGSRAGEPSGPRPAGTPASQNNSLKSEDSEGCRRFTMSDGYAPFYEDEGRSPGDHTDPDSEVKAQENRCDNDKSADHESSDIDAAEYANSRRQQTQSVGEEEDDQSSPLCSPTEDGPSTPIIHMHSGILPPPLSTITEEIPAKAFTVYMDPISAKSPLEIPPLAPPTARQGAPSGGNSDKPLPIQFSKPDDLESLEAYSDVYDEEMDEQESTTSEYMDQTPPRKYSEVKQSAHSATDYAAVILRRSPRKIPKDTPHPRTLLSKRAREVDELDIETPRKRAKAEGKSPPKPSTTKKTKTPKLAKAVGKKAKALRAPSGRVGVGSDGDGHHYTELPAEIDEPEPPTRRAKMTPKTTSKAHKAPKAKSTAKKSAIPARAKSEKRSARNPNEQTWGPNELEIGEPVELSYM